ncbi:speckle-type POZ protein-like protein [Metarhizium album ARSEF 1941]|uniref:Speckle-type POZ protein-like protein n=1 Tax=Metarhizium album (strain ARSEF 1941) TaxID=1081103 RepID=A0A0B2X5A5_METAS|nr:speckle-type POZ protein-like protein [Metarhizium album ARSEF 1941]KHO00486.1 speckle-type POZ protein-like protein [Metarhizium album ARSEF 1941]
MSATNSDSILAQMMMSGEFSDLIFICRGQEFKVHKAIVCAHSPVIKAAVQGEFEESQSNAIKMDSFQPKTVKRLVQFMYTGDYDETDEYEPSAAYQNACIADGVGAEEAADMENKFELRTEGGCIASSSSQELMLSLPKSTTTSSLSEHIYVNSIGDYYGVDKLVSLTNTKIKQLLQSGNEDESCVADLPIAIEAAAGLTGNRELMGVLASATAANISKLLCLDQFRENKLS